MRFHFDRDVAALLFVPGATLTLCSWLGLLAVPPLALLMAVPAMLLGGLGLLFQEFTKSS